MIQTTNNKAIPQGMALKEKTYKIYILKYFDFWAICAHERFWEFYSSFMC